MHGWCHDRQRSALQGLCCTLSRHARLTLQGVTVEKRMLGPQPLTPQTFAQRMREVDAPTSEAIFFELKAVGIIQADNCSRFLEYETWWATLHASGLHLLRYSCSGFLLRGICTDLSRMRLVRRKKAEAQLKKILLKHFPANLYAVNGSRGHERAFREMLWASEASEPRLRISATSQCMHFTCRVWRAVSVGG